MRLTRRFGALLALVCLSTGAAPQKKKDKDKEEQTQTLQLPKELPGAVTAATHRLTFHVTPLSSKGLLSPQVREALKALAHQCGNETVLKIRAFVAGSGDLRRVRDLVSAAFTERKQPLPALTLVRAGGLPVEGAQVVLEAIAAARKDVNPHGLAFLSAQVAASENPLDPVAPLAANSLTALGQAVQAAGAQPGDVLRVTCFLSSLDNLDATRKVVGASFPAAAIDFVRPQRSPAHALAACEAVARLASDPPGGVRLVESERFAGQNGQSEMALVNTPELVLTGAQASFGFQQQDARLAFDRLQNELRQAGSSSRQVVFAQYYPLSQSIADQTRSIRSQVFAQSHPPAGSEVLFEGLPSMDAGFAVDVVAVR